MSRFLLSLTLLTGTYLLVLLSTAAWDLVLGAILSTLLLVPLRALVVGGALPPIPHLGRRLLALTPFLLAVVCWYTVP